MKIWVLYKHTQATSSQKHFYSFERMLQEAEKQNFEIEIVTPEILLKNLENNIVPDAIFPRM